MMTRAQNGSVRGVGGIGLARSETEGRYHFNFKFVRMQKHHFEEEQATINPTGSCNNKSPRVNVLINANEVEGG